MNITLSKLTEVSNNSKLTKDLRDKLNEQLDESAKRDFLQWLSIVEQKSRKASPLRIKI